MTLWNAFREGMYHVLVFFQGLTEPLLGSQSYWFAIVLLTLAVRLLLIPLTLKQVRSARAMQEIAPEMRKLQAKYKNDRQKLAEEQMKLFRERGVNPMAGCWPLIAQAPFFFALYQVIYSPKIAGEDNILHGHGFFGIGLETYWSRLPGDDKIFSAPGITILLLVLASAFTTYISSRQLMNRQMTEANPQQELMIKLMPALFVIFAINVPLAVIIYWVTTNLWSIAQQWLILRTNPAPAAATATSKAGAGGGAPSGGGLGLFRPGRGGEDAKPGASNGGPRGKAPQEQAGAEGEAKPAPAASRGGGGGSRKGGGSSPRRGSRGKAGSRGQQRRKR